ncbi:hypothetical protein [Burkholderia cepacia]|uniref:Uncharacterized protein n=1 Tax=Burkholderia cepacia TaxID=292 RepID=A0A8E1S7Z6_BURCE|nr:hypothetical protein [Burkholderia cepacia]KVS52724.1 hypothetical protein WK39_25555 [Burkholderia cepacia]KVS56948.1 hypothetical protein WK40_27750 [Burkholderia cepacia]KWF84431.1 hypothetical protein WL94_22705 [Burkholderia cepacia]MBA9901544.1 hypothetical protein [Burkholderia cepacia]MBA9945083.1 hypothetical protein [Burkholderia cepacia]
MKFQSVIHAARKFAKYGIFMAPLAPRFGGGWMGILAGSAIRALVFAVGYALLLYLLNNWSLFKWSAGALCFLLYAFLQEAIMCRAARR